MSANRKPATALPFVYDDTRGTINDTSYCPVALMTVRSRDGDGSYLAHAANAYPKLVEALRKARTMAAAGAPLAAGNPHLMNPSDAEQIARFDLLLRDLGESE